MVNTSYQNTFSEVGDELSSIPIRHGEIRLVVEKRAEPTFLERRSIIAVLGVGQRLTTADIGQIFVRAAPAMTGNFMFTRPPSVMLDKNLYDVCFSLKLTEITSDYLYFETTHGQETEKVCDLAAWLSEGNRVSDRYMPDGIKIGLSRVIWDDDRWITREAYAPFAKQVIDARACLPRVECQCADSKIMQLDGSLYV